MIFSVIEHDINQINFYSGEEKLAKVGFSDDHLKKWGKRVEIFEIADDEQLIGCELYHGPFNSKDCFLGVAWLKCKITK